tara:strand:- start:38317 stop:38562 length:246 start_codon:yes stop_codon:yes gene_type:complete
MSFYTYILQSEKTGRMYIGQTNNLEDRLHRHNSNHNISTKNRGPWKLMHFVEFETRIEAVQLERQLKSWKSSKKVLVWIEK